MARAIGATSFGPSSRRTSFSIDSPESETSPSFGVVMLLSFIRRACRRRVKSGLASADLSAMTWWYAVPIALACLAVFWLPGWLILTAARVRGLLALALAPAVGAGVLGLSSWLCLPAGVAWGPVPAALGTALFAGTAHLLYQERRRRDREPSRQGGRPSLSARRTDSVRSWNRWGLPVALGVAVAAQVVPVAIGMVRPNRVQNAWDALFHLSAIQSALAEGRVDPSWLALLAAPDRTASFYPHAWHAAASLVPQWAGPLVSLNVATVLPCAVATAIGAAALARELFPAIRHLPALTALVTGMGIPVPLSIALQPGLVPNAFALSLVPGALAAVVRLTRSSDARALELWLVAGLAAAGVGLAHPGALIGLSLVALPWVAVRAWPWIRSGLRSGWGRARVLGAAGALLGAVVLVAANPTSRLVASINHKPPQTANELAMRLLTGNLGEWMSYPIVPVFLGVLACVSLARRPGSRRPVVAFVLTVAAYCAAASSFAILSSLTALWYSEERRVAPLVGVLLAPLAAYGLVVVTRAAVRHVTVPPRIGETGAHVLVAGTVVVLCLVPGVESTTDLAWDTYTQEVAEDPEPFDRVPYLSPAEEQLLTRLPALVGPDDLVLGSSLSGAGHLAALSGGRVVQPYHTTLLSADALYVSEHLPELGDDPRVCEAVRDLGARYVYVDPHPLHSTYWHSAGYGSFTDPPPAGTEVVDRAGDVVVYSLEQCY